MDPSETALLPSGEGLRSYFSAVHHQPISGSHGQGHLVVVFMTMDDEKSYDSKVWFCWFYMVSSSQPTLKCSMDPTGSDQEREFSPILLSPDSGTIFP